MFGRGLCCKNADWSQVGLSTPKSRGFCVEVPDEECHNFSKGAGPTPKGSFNDASLSTDVAGQVEYRGLALAYSPHHLETLDRRVGCLQRLETFDRLD